MTAALSGLKTIQCEAIRPRTFKDMQLNNTPAAILTELEEAQKELALFQRLQTAEARVNQLTQQYDAARADQERAEAAALEAAKKARFDNLADIRFAFVPNKDGGSELHWSYRITWRAPLYDPRTGTSPVGEHLCTNVQALPRNVVEFLVEKHPEQIPRAIMALAPGDPWRALDAFLTARRRGHVRSAR